MRDKIQIIVADDHPLYRNGVVRSIEEEEDLEVVAEASNANTLVDLVESLSPSIALLDISMPGNGIKAVQKITQLSTQTKTIMLTVSEHDDDVIQALEAGASGYVLKGVGSDELISIIRDVNAGKSYVPSALAARVLLAKRSRDNERTPSEKLLRDLTVRETQILKAVSLGLSNKAVGIELELQEKTVKHHMTSILRKLQVKNRVEATLIARDLWQGPTHTA